jgi:serine protease Do
MKKTMLAFLALGLLAFPVRAEITAVYSFKDAAKKIKPAVVNISTVKNVKGLMGGWQSGDPRFDEFFSRFFGGGGAPEGRERTFKSASLGSGVIVDAASGYVVTNNHVVEDADKIKVKLSDRREFDAEIVGRDPQTDLAVIRILKANDLKAAAFGDSDLIEVGDFVLAIGSPFGLEQTVSHGIISAKGRVIGAGPYDDFLQTDAPINPGNSGGPLVNLNGDIVGINTAITSRSGGSEGVGFAIPSSLARKVYSDLAGSGHVTRGWLGISIQELDETLAAYVDLPRNSAGVFVGDVTPQSPASRAGLKARDVILDFDGKKVKTVRELQMAVADSAVGASALLTVWRDKNKKGLRVKIGNMDESEQEDGSVQPDKPGNLGLSYRALSPQEREDSKIEEGLGVIVAGVEPGSAAEESGIQPGDAIVELDKARITNAAEFRRLAAKLKPGKSYVIRVIRQKRGLYLTLKLGEK